MGIGRPDWDDRWDRLKVVDLNISKYASYGRSARRSIEGWLEERKRSMGPESADSRKNQKSQAYNRPYFSGPIPGRTIPSSVSLFRPDNELMM